MFGRPYYLGMNYKELTPTQEQLINDFVFELAMIDGPDDMFPPDNFNNDHEPRNPLVPGGIDSQAISFAAVYDLLSFRRKKLDHIRRNMGELALV